MLRSLSIGCADRPVGVRKRTGKMQGENARGPATPPSSRVFRVQVITVSNDTLLFALPIPQEVRSCHDSQRQASSCSLFFSAYVTEAQQQSSSSSLVFGVCRTCVAIQENIMLWCAIICSAAFGCAALICANTVVCLQGLVQQQGELVSGLLPLPLPPMDPRSTLSCTKLMPPVSRHQ